TAYLNAFFEGGTVLLILLLKMKGIVLSTNQTLLLVTGCCLAVVLLLLWHFVPDTNFEIRYSEAEPPAAGPDSSFKRLSLLFGLMSMMFGAIEVSEDYLVKIVVQHGLQNYEAIRSMTDSYFSVSSGLIVVLGLLTGKAI